MGYNTFEELYVEQLKDLHSAEVQLLEALPKMAQAASHSELKDAFNTHLEQTNTHHERLHKILSELGEDSGGHNCQAMKGLIKEGQEIIDAPGTPAVKDAALIAAAQRVEHYEIAGYGTVRTFARHLKQDEHVKILQTTLDEEANTDELLTKLAEGGIKNEGINDEAEG